MRVATTRYQNAEVIRDSGLAPVRITVGAPRFTLGYDLAGAISAFAPERAWMDLDREPFQERMVAKLFTLGPTQAVEILTEMGGGYAGVVMLCFEKVPDEWCHRTMVADWLLAQCGITVIELEDRAPPPKPQSRRPRDTGPAEQRSLFEMPVGEASKRVVDKASMLVTSGKVHRGLGGVYLVEASSDPNLMYDVTVEPPFCPCKWGQSPNPSACSHLLAARYVDEFGEPPTVALLA